MASDTHSKMKRVLKIIGVVILVVVLLVLRTVWKSGAFKSLDYGFDGTTQRLDGLVGVEDITIDQSNGIAFLSASDRWASMIHHKPTKGAIYSLNLNDSVLRPLALTLRFGMNDFHPHGISLYTTSDARKILFVINHRENGDSQV